MMQFGKLRTVRCEGCGEIILIWAGQDKLCHNCKQKKPGEKLSEETIGLQKWMSK